MRESKQDRITREGINRRLRDSFELKREDLYRHNVLISWRIYDSDHGRVICLGPHLVLGVKNKDLALYKTCRELDSEGRVVVMGERGVASFLDSHQKHGKNNRNESGESRYLKYLIAKHAKDL